MKESSINFLDTHRHYYTTFVQAQIIVHLDHPIMQGILDVIREEFDPGYLTSFSCGVCVIDMLKFAYVQYDKWKLSNTPVV